VVTLIVIFATISVGRVAERAKELEAERDKGLLPAGKVGPAHSFLLGCTYATGAGYGRGLKG
jgi:hypothetical protein